jgi:hypothetical protein
MGSGENKKKSKNKQSREDKIMRAGDSVKNKLII